MPRNITRFAPSPTGLLHIGHAMAALYIQQWLKKQQRTCLLRIEDIDFTRCKAKYNQAIIDDLQWLGLNYENDIRYQSQHLNDYQTALQQLQDMQVVYPCFCSRSELQKNTLNNVYAGTCKQLSTLQQKNRMQQQAFAWRMDCQKAAQIIDSKPIWFDHQYGEQRVDITALGDFVVARKDIGISYHLAVVVDDHLQGITHVIRGDDLRSSTPIHCLLQALLQYPTPSYEHHPLLLDLNGQRLAKRLHSTTLQSLRLAGVSSAQLKSFFQDFFMQNNPVWRFQHDEQAEKIAQLLGSGTQIHQDTPNL